MARKRNRVSVGPVLLIACEGTSSEYNYFESWAKLDNVLEKFGAVNVYPGEHEDKPKTTPYELLLVAKEALRNGSADIAWIVFDKDNHPKLEQTFAEAEKDGIHIAYSSRSFEEWVLLHYERNINPFQATECKDEKDKPTNCGTNQVPLCDPIDCLSGHIRRQNHIPNYSKKSEFDLFEEVSEKTEIAIINAAWLRFKTNTSLNIQNRNLPNANPYCDVDQLILELNGREDQLVWGPVNTDITLGNWTIHVTKTSANIVVKLSHTLQRAQVLNETFLSESMFTLNNSFKRSPVVIRAKRYLRNNSGSNSNLLRQGDIIEFTLDKSSRPYFLFSADSDLNRIFIEL